MNRLITLLFLAGMAVPLLAANLVKDPIADYLGRPDAPQNHLITNNGIQEVVLEVSGENVTFISAHGYSTEGGSIWTAYLPNGKEYEPVDAATDGQPIVFNEAFLYNGAIPELSLNGFFTYLRKTNDTGDLWFYQIVKGKFIAKKAASLNLKKEKDMTFLTKYFEDRIHPLIHMSEGELVNKGYTLPVDKSAKPQAEPVPQPPPTIASSPAPAPAAPAQPAPVVEDTSVPTWLYATVILSLVLIGGAWFFLRSKK